VTVGRADPVPGIVAAVRAVEPALDTATITRAVTGAGAAARLRQVAAVLASSSGPGA